MAASVDIVIPCYNYAHFLPQCIQTVLTQGVENIRIIIIDNASSDGSVEVARRLMETDDRIELVRHQANLGPHASFNEGIDLARADYFMILCADDIAAANAISSGITLLERFPEIAVVLGSYVELLPGEMPPEGTAQSTGYGVSSGKDFIERCCGSLGHIPAHAILVRTSLQKRVGHYRASIRFMDDLEMVLRLATTGLVAELHGPLAIRRIHNSSSLSESLWEDGLRLLEERAAVFDSFFQNEGAALPNVRYLHGVARRRVAEAAYWSAASHLVRGRRNEAADLFELGCRLNETTMLVPPVGYLFRKQGALKRIATVLSGAFR